MADDAFTKSPLNQAVGSLLRELAHGPRKEAELANRLDLSKSYFKAIVAGTRALPPYTAANLTLTYGLDYFATSGLLALVSELDIRRSRGDSDLQKIRTRAEQLKIVVPGFTKLLNWLIDAIERLEGGEAESPLDVRYLQELLNDRPSISAPREEAKQSLAPLLSSYPMSPAFWDILDSLAVQMSLFQPAMDVGSFATWESANQERITGIRCYVTDIERLIQDAQKFDWAFLGNNHSPMVRMIISEDDSQRETADYTKKLHDALRQKLRSRSNANDPVTRVELKKVGAAVTAFDKLLVWDSVTHATAGTDEPAVRKTNQKSRYVTFENVWIYELQPTSAPTGRHHVGFLGQYFDARNWQAASVAVLNQTDVARWQKLLTDAWEKDTAELTLSRQRADRRGLRR